MKCGFVSFVGAPNAGKSTLLNQIMKMNLSIVTHKVQTTRTKIRGIHTQGDTQLIFVDTPGIFKSRNRLDNSMVNAAFSEIGETDVLCVVVDAVKGLCKNTKIIIDKIQNENKKADLVLNKIDLVKKEKLALLTNELYSYGIFEDVYMVSALKNKGVDFILEKMMNKIPEGQFLYNEDSVTDISNSLLAAEITREKVFLNIHQEIPYNITVETENWERFKDGSLKIFQVIYVDKEIQKSIILGHMGERIRRISTASRIDMAEIFGEKIHLSIFVKVKSGWKNDAERYEFLNLDFKDK